MCNPNSTIANRRRQAVSLPQGAVSKSSLALTRSLFGNVGSRQATATASPPAQQRGTTVAPSVMTSQPRNLEVSADGLSNKYAVSPTIACATNAVGAPVYLKGYGFIAPPTKPKPKRRRRPQKPGKTAKQHDRHFVVHNYHDHSNDVETAPDESECSSTSKGGHRRGGVTVAFPFKLHDVLDQVERDGLSCVVSWQPHGRCFVIHKPDIFTEHVMPKYFRQSKLTSFQRQLNLYGFNRLTRGADSGGYYHELFLRGKPYLCNRMVRTKVKGTKFKAASSPDQEPDFYRMPPVLVSNATDGLSAPASAPPEDNNTRNVESNLATGTVPRHEPPTVAHQMQNTETSQRLPSLEQQFQIQSSPSFSAYCAAKEQQQQQQQQDRSRREQRPVAAGAVDALLQLPIMSANSFEGQGFFPAEATTAAGGYYHQNTAVPTSPISPGVSSYGGAVGSGGATPIIQQKPKEELSPSAPPPRNHHHLKRKSDVLDEVVDELFIDEPFFTGWKDSILDDFVNIWDPPQQQPNYKGAGGNVSVSSLSNDAQLATLLNLLVED